jgi:hypothetical protein
MSILKILLDPENSKISLKFFQFSFLLILLPIGFLLLTLRLGLLSPTAAGIFSVILVNVITVLYGVLAYREEKADYEAKESEKKKK